MATIKLKNVRLSFASLFKKATFGGEETKYEGTFLIDKETQADQIAEINTAIAAMMKEKKAKLSPDRICFKDGDEIDYDGYAGHMSIKASNAKRPIVIDRDKSPLTEDDGRPYSGCYVNAVLELWFQDNTWGKRVNANFWQPSSLKDGEPFGEGGASVSVDDFDVIDEDDDIF
jgi:co-chaperonin GroES (HSP10)